MAFAIFNQPIPIRRAGTGQYVDGIWVAGAATDGVIQGSIQPASANDTTRILDRLPEGSRIRAAYLVYTRDVVSVGDTVDIHGEDYAIMQSDIWQNRILPHYCLMAVKMQEAGVL